MKINFSFSIAATTAILCFSQTALAALGPSLFEHELPPQVCVISFEQGNPDTDRFVEVCTGTLVRDRLLLTAGHCGEAPPESLSVFCPSSNTAVKVKTVHSAPDFDNEAMKRDERLRSYDVALLELESPLPSVKAELSWQNHALDEYEECAFFGYSNLLGKTKNTSLPPPDRIRVPVSNLRLEEGLFKLEGYWAPGALVEPGDSGGALACRRQTMDWQILGVTSGRDFDFRSYFAPLFKNPKLETVLLQAPEDRTGLYEIGQHQNRIRSHYQKDLEQCETRLQAAFEKVGETFERHSSLPESLREADRLLAKCRKQELDFIRTRPNLVYRLKPFSELRFQNPVWPGSLPEPEKRRLENWDKSFSSVDHTYNRFYIERIEGDQVYGQLELLAFSEGFICRGSFLCREGLYQGAVTSLHNILLEVLAVH